MPADGIVRLMSGAGAAASPTTNVSADPVNAPTSSPAVDLVERLRALDCVMVEICEPHPGNPSANILPVERVKLIAALSTPAPALGEEEAREVLAATPHADGCNFLSRAMADCDCDRPIRAMLAFASLRSGEREAIARISARLIDQTDEPWPGTNAKRLHYWRDKAIDASKVLDAILSLRASPQGLGVPASPSGSREPNPSVPALRASIPNALDIIGTDRNTMLQALYDAKLQLEYLESRWPTGTTPPTLARVEAAIANALPWHVIASAIEARSGETAQQARSGTDESAVAESETPNLPPHPSAREAEF